MSSYLSSTGFTAHILSKMIPREESANTSAYVSLEAFNAASQAFSCMASSRVWSAP